MDRDKTRLELQRLVAEAPKIAPSIARFGEERSYGNVTDENLDVPSFVRWELEAAAILQQLAVSGVPVFTDLHARYLGQKEASKKFHSRSILVHQIMQLLISALQLLDSPLAESEHWQVNARRGRGEAAAPNSAPTAHPSTAVAGELPSPEKVTIAWAVRHVPLSGWSYLGGIILSVFLAGITLGQLPFVRSLVTRIHEDSPLQSRLTRPDLDENIRHLTRGIRSGWPRSREEFSPRSRPQVGRAL